MEHIGVLPEPSDVLPTSIIPLFGLLCYPKSKEEECHICLEKFTNKTAFIIETPCCAHLAHTECFQTWAESPLNESKIRCAYCRSAYDLEEICFLCIKDLKDADTKCTNCCHSKVHTDCALELQDLLTSVMFEHTVECGQLNYCHCIWVHL